MANKNFDTRIQHKHDTEANWLKATTFIPMKGELIVYDVDATHDYERIKMGDGITNVNALPFVYEPVTEADIMEICGVSISRLEGDGGEYYTLAPTALTFRSTEPLTEFQEVKVNGEVVDPSNYTLEEGSTIVKLSIDYLKTLDVGNYDIEVVSEKNAPRGGFTVVAPQLNEHGFYYNQPYTADINAFGGETVFFMRKNGTMDLIITYSQYTEVCSYTINENNLTINAESGIFTGYITEDGMGIYCNELAETFVLCNNTTFAADDDYIYIYKEDLGGYEVTAIDKTKAEYGAIKTGINGIDTVKLADYMFVDNNLNISAPIVSIAIPDSVQVIGYCAFEKCALLQSVVFGEYSNLQRIEDHAFGYCANLINISLPDNVYAIGSQAFLDCSNLTEFVCPSELITLGYDVFMNCKKLNRVMIPVNIKYVYDAFIGCNSLVDIVYEGTVAQWNAIVKKENWNDGIPATHVQCSDGDVAL